MKIGCPDILWYDEDKRKFIYTSKRIRESEYKLVCSLRPAIRLIVKAFLKGQLDIHEANLQIHTCPVRHGYNIEIFD